MADKPLSYAIKQRVYQAAQRLGISDPVPYVGRLLDRSFMLPAGHPQYGQNNLTPGTAPFEPSFSEREPHTLRFTVEPARPPTRYSGVMTPPAKCAGWSMMCLAAKLCIGSTRAANSGAPCSRIHIFTMVPGLVRPMIGMVSTPARYTTSWSRATSAPCRLALDGLCRRRSTRCRA